MSIRKKLTVFIVCLLAFAVSALSAIVFFQERKILEERILSSFTALLDARRDLVVSQLEMEISNASAISSRRIPRDYLIRKASDDPALSQFAGEAFKTLTDAKNSIRSILAIDVFDLQGAAVLSVGKSIAGRGLEDAALFKKALNGPCLSDMYSGNGLYLLDVAVPAYSPLTGDAKVIGVYKITFIQNRLMALLNNYHGLGNTGEIVLGKRSGNDVVFINPLRNLKVKDPAIKFVVPLSSGKAEAMALALQQKSGIGVFRDYRDTPVLAAYDYIPLAGWGIVVKIDLAEAYRSIREMLWIILMISLAILICFSFVGIYFSGFLVKPVKELNSLVNRIAQGDFSVKAVVSSKDELGQLASAFNQMTESLFKVTASRDELNREIEQRKAVEEGLRSLQQRLADIIEFFPDAVFVVDKDKRVVSWNKAIESMTGVRKADIIGKGDHEYAVHFYDERRPMLIDLVFEPVESLMAKYRDVVKQGDTLSVETFAPKLYQGKGAFIGGVAAPLFGEKGEIIGAIETIRDFTARKQAEEDRKNALDEAVRTREIFASMLADNNQIRDELEQRVKELKATYAELKDTQAQLIQSAKLAAMGQLIAGVSHELNQPLTGIKGFSQTLYADLVAMDVPDASRQDLQRIIEQTNRMSSIIENLRLFARKADVNQEKIDINTPVQAAVQLLGEQFKVHGINLEVRLAQGMPLIKGDTNQLQQVFLNFLTNAHDALENVQREDRLVSIQSQLSSDGRHIEVLVSDNGSGISSKDKEHIFNPFFTTKAPNRGMGLGLSIAYNIIHNHGGSIEVNSEEGKGSTFKVVLPVAS